MWKELSKLIYDNMSEYTQCIVFSEYYKLNDAIWLGMAMCVNQVMDKNVNKKIISRDLL